MCPRAQDDVETMKEQVRLLEAKYEQLYVAKTSSTRAQTGNNQSTGDINATLLDKYTQAREEMALLRTQIAAMKEKVIEYDRFSSAMETYLSDCATSAPSSSSVDEANPLVREEPKPFQPLSHATCFAIIQQCYQQIFHPQWRGQRISTGSQIFGWRDERFVDGTTLQFALTKPFENLSMEHMMHKTWDIVTTVEHMHTIQRSTIGVKVLQVVNDDILVTQRCVHHPQLNKVTCVNMLMFRLRTERGYVVAYVTINHPEQVAASQDENENQDEDSSSNQVTFFDIDEYMKDQKNARRETSSSGGKGGGDGTKKPKVSWVDMLQWFIFEEVPPLPSSPPCMVETEDDEDLEVLAASLLDPVPNPSSTSSSVVNVTFGGRMDNKDLHYVSYFLIEVVSMIMRWDQAVAYSRLTFYETESDDSASPSPSPWDSSEEYKWTS